MEDKSTSELVGSERSFEQGATSNPVGDRLAQMRREQLLRLCKERPPLIDCRKIVDGGIGTYTQNFVRALLDTGIRPVLLGIPEVIRQLPWTQPLEIIEERAEPYSLDESFLLARRIDFSRHALFHVPHYTLPRGVPVPTIVTIHDLIHVTHPETWKHRPAARLLIRSALKRATVVTTVSQATRQILMKTFPKWSKRSDALMVVPNQLPDWCENVELTSHREPLFFAAISQAKPHKGGVDLIEMFALVNDLHERSHRLVIAGYGAESLAAHPRVREIIEHRTDITMLGALGTRELSSWYKRAQWVVVPSIAEGFGLMMVEAHAHGTPVICRPVAALKELVQPADILARDLTRGGLADAIANAIKRGSVQEGIRAELQASVAHYRRENQRSAILDVYSRALGLFA
jgi:glycosyltransferase involved in cell wall biosynthesis